MFSDASLSIFESGGWTIHFRSLVKFPAPAFRTTDGKIHGRPIHPNEGNLRATAPTNDGFVGTGAQRHFASALSRQAANPFQGTHAFLLLLGGGMKLRWFPIPATADRGIAVANDPVSSRKDAFSMTAVITSH
jgi:hypothetical protein